MKYNLLNSSNQDVSNGGKFTSLVSVDKKLLVFLSFRVF